MNILMVIHGYPDRYNAGSEVYTRGLVHALARRHTVHVFTREEDAFAPEYRMRREPDPGMPGVTLHLINRPNSRDRYSHPGVDRHLAALLDSTRPDVVHIGHLNHLSTTLVHEVARRGIPMVFTLHDFWLMCPRGQFLQGRSGDDGVPWPCCDGQEDRKCAERCYSRYFGGVEGDMEGDVAHWTAWVRRRMSHVRSIAELVDLFIAPSRHLLDRFANDFGLPRAKLAYLPYGFDKASLAGRSRVPGEPFTFGFIGTHTPGKGIPLLLEAFGKLQGGHQLRIWGRPRGVDTAALHAMARSLPGDAARRVSWMGEYLNANLTRDVFNHVDAIVVPSIWVENSPLVIQEALQARVPVVTADVGGMAELVEHEVNGLRFRHRDAGDLAAQMQRMADSPDWAGHLGRRGLVTGDGGDVPAMEEHALQVESKYHDVRRRKQQSHVEVGEAPWRITFDTNPDDCNLRCIMCEEHSPHSPLQRQRIAEGRPRRRMDLGIIRKVLSEMAPKGTREIIPSTMGEPLLYEGFEGILALCREFNVRLNLTTNGTFPGLGATAWAERIVPVTSDTKISWNGARRETQEQVMLGTRWDRVQQNLRAFIEVRDRHAAAGGNRCRVTLQATFLETNYRELPDMVRMAAELGVDRIKGHHLWAHFDQIKPLSMRRSADSVARWNEAVAEAHQAAETHRRRDGNRVLLENIFPLSADAVENIAPGGRCPFLGREAWINASGRFDPCCAPDAQRRTLGDFGNVGEQSFGIIWNGPAYRDLAATYRNRALCIGCNMRKPEDVA